MRLASLRAFLALVLAAISFGAAAQSMPDFSQLEARLKIRPEQRDQYELAVGATKRALLAVGLAAMEMKETLVRELAKPSPDFRALARKQNELIEDQRPLFREAGEQWKKLYDVLDPKQVETVQQFLRENLGSLLAPTQ
jgi:hypothetical protein